MKKKNKNLNFLKKYLIDLSNLIRPTNEILNQLHHVRDIFLQTSLRKGKIFAAFKLLNIGLNIGLNLFFIVYLP